MKFAKNPLIGLTASHDQKADGLSLRSNYADAVSHFGGIPVILPLVLSDTQKQQLSDTLDGIIFTGGPDIHPFLFGEETLAGCGDMSSLRDKMELSFFSEMFQKKKPILGICRGAQLINIALGGAIYQDIASQFSSSPVIAHSQPFSYQSPSHHVLVSPDTLLDKILKNTSRYGTGSISNSYTANAPGSPAGSIPDHSDNVHGSSSQIEVNSMHHQAIHVTAPGLTVSGRAPDGLIEAVEMPDYPFLLAVQWHPEYLFEKDKCAARIFHAFVHACRTGSRKMQ